jgi:pyrrolidone-carboxylate peptidase
VQRKCASCEEEESLQRKEDGEGGSGEEAPAIVSDAVATGGAPLDDDTRSSMENRFGYDFSQVRIHTDTVAAKSAQAINAHAYTTGNHVVFNEGRYQPGTQNGQSLLAHELTHVVQQSAGIQRKNIIQRQPVTPTQAQLNQLCYNPSVTQPNPSAMNPELHPTYAGWIASFTGMATFTSNDTVAGATASSRFQVLGTAGRRFGDTTATAETEPAPVTGTVRSGEEFIDHPTNQWVVNCLPANLRATAYQLPADCADIAVILRHVWLAAHHRTETFGTFTLGDGAGRANQPLVSQLIRDIFTGNVGQMVNPYVDANGNNLTNFNSLQNLLHNGDVLVWEHREVVTSGTTTTSRRTGGHTQTINNIVRDDQGNITRLEVLQGNQPIFSDAATAILQSRGASNTDPNSPEGHALRELPGRRIEAANAISIANITHPVTNQVVWGVGGNPRFTMLTAAGPPRAANRPRAGSGGRAITDWRTAIQRATLQTVAGVLESTLQEARSIAEGGNAVSGADMTALGQEYGQRVRTLFSANTTNLLQRIQNFVTVIRALRNDSINAAATTAAFNSFEQAFVQNALPGSTAEERRVFSEHSSISNSLTPFAAQITALSTALTQARNLAQARTAAEQQGTALWQAATTLAQATTGASQDDRPLYWSRLRMIQQIRQFRSVFTLSATDRQQLVDIFERASRGIPASAATSVFPSSATGKRILISGFDPFGLPTDINDSNPSGAVVLAMDGRTLSASNITAHIEGVNFPVRYRDFDQGLIETFFRSYLDGTHPVNMIMTISQGRSSFQVEQWAGRRRSADLPDNEGTVGGSSTAPVIPPALSPGTDEFLETRLPHAAMTQVPQTSLNPARDPAAGVSGPAVTGSGGGFLSNEIFYRVRLLQQSIGGNAVTIPVGHLHIPANVGANNQAIINRVQEILQAALPAI